MYGACSTLGKNVAKVFALYNYGVLLVDANLSKLQELQKELIQVFPNLQSEDWVRIVNINLASDPNSTVIEHRLHKALFGKKTWHQAQTNQV